MDSTTLFYRKIPDFRSVIPGLFALILTACAQGEANFGFSIQQVESRQTAGTLVVSVHQQMKLSREAKKALTHGVPLTIQTELALRQIDKRHNLEQAHREFEIRFLPLSNRYQLTIMDPPSVRTFPRLRHALAKLARVEFRFSPEQVPGGELELRARTFLNKQRMPPPMRLPAWFSSQWKHDSGWATRSLSDISGA